MDCNSHFASIGTIIIDDIILPDGTSHMGQLGGGLTHAGMGMRVWSPNVSLLSVIGPDFPEAIINKMSKWFDLSNLITRSVRTPRAWQLFESDGTRNEIFRSSFDDMIIAEIEPREVPAHLIKKITGVHLHCAPLNIPGWVKWLRQNTDIFILWEPWDNFCAYENRPLFRKLAPLVDAVSPNLREGSLLTGENNPFAIGEAMIADGAKIVVLRMGSEGSLIMAHGEQPIRLSSPPVKQIIDVTGAGNAYCGGFISGFSIYKDLFKAGVCASVSASFALEQFGALYQCENMEKEAFNRFNHYYKEIRK